MGRDKAFIAVQGMPLWQRQVQMLEELCPAEILLAGPAHPDWQKANCVIIPDAEPDAGPLAGIAGALQRSRESLLLVVAVDLPNMTGRYLRGLLSSCMAGCGVVPTRRDHLEPLVAVYPKRALAIAATCLASGEFSVQKFVERCLAGDLLRPKEIAAHEMPFFFNMNTPEDLATLTDA